MEIHTSSLVACLTALLLALPNAVPSQAIADEEAAAIAVTAGLIAAAVFSDREKRVFREYLEYEVGGKKQKSLPPGLRKKLERGGSLPPGWQMKVQRGEVLEPDLYRLTHALPGDILRRLPPGPRGTSIVQLDDRIIRILDATHAVLDVYYLTQGH